MKFWQKTLLVVLIAAFPGGVIAYRTLDKSVFISKAQPAADVERAVAEKAEELAALDLQIVTVQGELLKYQERKRDAVAGLEALRQKIATLIDQSSNH